jgi:hypothetical protein
VPLPSSQAAKENPITATNAIMPNSFTLFFIKCSFLIPEISSE